MARREVIKEVLCCDHCGSESDVVEVGHDEDVWDLCGECWSLAVEFLQLGTVETVSAPASLQAKGAKEVDGAKKKVAKKKVTKKIGKKKPTKKSVKSKVILAEGDDNDLEAIVEAERKEKLQKLLDSDDFNGTIPSDLLSEHDIKSMTPDDDMINAFMDGMEKAKRSRKTIGELIGDPSLDFNSHSMGREGWKKEKLKRDR